MQRRWRIAILPTIAAELVNVETVKGWVKHHVFTETLRAASEPGWAHAVGHRFVKELLAGAVPDAVMARYLIQDHRFLDSFLTLLGAALASADMFEARLRFGRFIGMVSG